ncbi:hypothetical protein RHGRI_002445 [Rhododendron griersonianum]|uniref:DUF632 domain-containing protein n=1 Tax=Rhododendron griersonianum TaxID=479676 RepID=A0AAV6LR81_9ERIC|nr:hypothetical protein RHGRI_002445 [Rhododendron griersonianum]
MTRLSPGVQWLRSSASSELLLPFRAFRSSASGVQLTVIAVQLTVTAVCSRVYAWSPVKDSEDIEHRFFRASESGKEVSRMLEASKIRVGYSDAKGGSAVSDFLAALRLTCCRGNALVSHGCLILMDSSSDKSIAFLLLAAFQTRYKEVLIKAQTAALAVAPKFLTILTKEETKLYEAAQSSMAAFKKWRMGGPRFQKASVLGRKRRPSD